MDYNLGLEILRKLHSYIRTPITFDKFLDALSRDWQGIKIPEEDFRDYVSGLSKTKKLFLGIPWKSASDFDKILKKIADKTPKGKLPDRRMIDSAFINPDTFKPSLVDYAELLAKASKEAATKGIETAKVTAMLYLAVKIIGAGVAAYSLVNAFAAKKRLK